MNHWCQLNPSAADFNETSITIQTFQETRLKVLSANIGHFVQASINGFSRYQENNRLIRLGMATMGFQELVKPEDAGYIVTSFLYPKTHLFDFNEFYQELFDKGEKECRLISVNRSPNIVSEYNKHMVENHFNSLAPGRWGCSLKLVNFNSCQGYIFLMYRQSEYYVKRAEIMYM